MTLDETIDEGSPIGGAAFAAGILAVSLTVVQIPAAALGAGWIPACFALVAAPAALIAGALSLVTEDSPRGRRNARRGLILGLLGMAAQMVMFVVTTFVINAA